MRVALLAGALVIGGVLLVSVLRAARAARRGNSWRRWAAMTVAVAFVYWLLVIGFAVGYASAGTAVAGGIGAGAVGVLILIVGPILRIWGVQRRTRPHTEGQA